MSPISLGGFENLIARLCTFGRKTCTGGSYFSAMRGEACFSSVMRLANAKCMEVN